MWRTPEFRRVLPPLVVGVGFLLLWQVFVVSRRIQPYVLPKPTAIWDQFTANASGIFESAKASGTNALVGLLAGSVLAIATAILAARSRLADELLTPVAAAVNAMPIIALAPVFNTMFSSTSAVPRRLVVTVVVFFPVFVNTVRGLREIDPVHQELLQSYAATPWQLTRTVRLPGALPFVFTGLRVASSLAVIAAVVSEYFGGLQHLGRRQHGVPEGVGVRRRRVCAWPPFLPDRTVARTPCHAVAGAHLAVICQHATTLEGS
jgi:NitT/TauT family transport system permease protein